MEPAVERIGIINDLRVEQHRCGDPVGHVVPPSSWAVSGDNHHDSSVDPTMSVNRIVAPSVLKNQPPAWRTPG